MNDKSDKSVELNNIYKNYSKNNFKAGNIFSNNSNITGITFDNHIHKKEKLNFVKKINNLKESIKFFPIKNNNNIESNFYKSLSEIEKTKYIQNIIKNSLPKEPFDFMAIKRKKYSLGYLIRQFDLSEKSKTLEENKICQTPYPLLYCLSNRKIGNDSSNLLAKILTSENKKLSKKQEKVIKYSNCSKIFNADISDLIKRKIKKKSTLKSLNNNINKKRINLSKICSNKDLPFLNKFIKEKFYDFKFDIMNRNVNINKSPNSIGFFSQKKYKKVNLKKNMKRWNSIFTMNIKGKENLSDNYKQFKNLCDTFKNKTVCLDNHKNNIINYSLINKRKNKKIDDFFFSKRNDESDSRINEIIQDASHLKFNNKLIPFNTKINDL